LYLKKTILKNNSAHIGYFYIVPELVSGFRHHISVIEKVLFRANLSSDFNFKVSHFLKVFAIVIMPKFSNSRPDGSD